MAPAPRILASACLLGSPVRYDARDNRVVSDWLTDCQARGLVHAVCPEVLGGLPTPRPPAEIVGGTGADVLQGRARVMTRDGTDVTPHFVAGAQRALDEALAHGVALAVLKARSPSCASLAVYDGTFSRALEAGMGVTAALFARHGIAVFDEEHLEGAKAHYEALLAAGCPGR